MRIPLLAGAALLAACAGRDSSSWRFSVRTSTAGDTTIVRSITADSVPVIPLVEELRLGNANPDAPNAFERVAEVVVDRSGRIAVFDRGRKALLLFHPDGTPIGTVGREGAGPGEFQTISPGWLTFTSTGAIAMWDAMAGRLLLYDSTGAPIATVPVTEAVGGYASLSADDKGRVLLRRGQRDREVIMTFGPDGIREPATRRVPVFGKTDELVAGDKEQFTEETPFGARSVVAVTHDGGFVGGNSSAYDLLVTGGRAPRRIVREATQAKVADGEKAFWQEEMVAYFRQMDPTWTWRGTIPSKKAWFTDLRPGDDGTLLVRVARPGTEKPNPDAGQPEKQGQRLQPATYWSEPAVWERFDRDGKLTGELRLPERARIRAVRGNRIWVVQPDSMDVPYVVRYRLAGVPN